MSQHYKRPESVLVVVYTCAGEVLLLRRAEGPDYWQSVTGSMHWGDEQPHAAALRELHEETGITVGSRTLHDWQRSNRYVIFPGRCRNRCSVCSASPPTRRAPSSASCWTRSDWTL